MQRKRLVKIVKLLFILLLTNTSAYANQDIHENLLSGWNTINQTSLLYNINYLTSDDLQGRLSLTEGDKKAIIWIADQFRQAGLKPGNGQSYLQAVPLVQYVANPKQNFISLDNDDQNIKWQSPDITISFRNDLTLSGSVVFAGFGITAPALHYDDYQNIDVHRKIVLVFEHEPQEQMADSIFNGKANTRHAITRTKVLNAQQHGAIAVLIAPEPNRNHPSNQERRSRIKDLRTTPIPSQVLVDDEVKIPYALLTDKVAQQIAGDHLSLSKLQSLIDQTLTPQSQLIPKTQVTLHSTNLSKTYGVSYNVVGLLEGNDPILKNETILISAHHDHDGMSNGYMWRGADDNASGTAGVISLASAFVKNVQEGGLQPKRSILFVVFAAEERGLLGAFYMAAHPLRPLSRTRAMINFDMIGRNEQESEQTNGLIDIPADTTNRLNLIGTHYSPDYHQAVIKNNERVGLTLDERFDNETALNVFFRSDQFPFVLHHIPAFWWFTGFDPDYHQPSDTAEKINYDKMQKILRLAYLTAYSFANEKSTPQFVENPVGKT